MKKATKTVTTVPKRTAAAIAADPLNLTWRLYQQLGKLLDDMEAADRDETMTFPQRINAMIAVGRVQKMFVDLRKGDLSLGAGSAVAKYATAFAPPTHATRGGRPPTGTGVVIEPEPYLDDAEPGDPDYEPADAA